MVVIASIVLLLQATTWRAIPYFHTQQYYLESLPPELQAGSNILQDTTTGCLYVYGIGFQRVLPNGEVDTSSVISTALKRAYVDLLEWDGAGKLIAMCGMYKDESLDPHKLWRLHPNGIVDTSFRPKQYIEWGPSRQTSKIHFSNGDLLLTNCYDNGFCGNRTFRRGSTIMVKAAGEVKDCAESSPYNFPRCGGLIPLGQDKFMVTAHYHGPGVEDSKLGLGVWSYSGDTLTKDTAMGDFLGDVFLFPLQDGSQEFLAIEVIETEFQDYSPNRDLGWHMQFDQILTRYRYDKRNGNYCLQQLDRTFLAMHDSLGMPYHYHFPSAMGLPNGDILFASPGKLPNGTNSCVFKWKRGQPLVAILDQWGTINSIKVPRNLAQAATAYDKCGLFLTHGDAYSKYETRWITNTGALVKVK